MTPEWVRREKQAFFAWNRGRTEPTPAPHAMQDCHRKPSRAPSKAPCLIRDPAAPSIAERQDAAPQHACVRRGLATRKPTISDHKAASFRRGAGALLLQMHYYYQMQNL